jgi:D-cysteine desulfhydrase
VTSRLHERFPALRESLPRIPLGAGPTPVRRLDRVSERAGLEVWVKDDSRFGDLWGGNKPRKLEWTLADVQARGRRSVVTFGALATNHGLATARYARRLGLRATLLLVDQPVDDHVRAQLERIRESGAVLRFTHGTARTAAALPGVVLREWRATGRRPTVLPVGGSSPLGAVGFVEAALELAEQVRAGEAPEPAWVVVALGSGGTAAGLTLGLRLAGLSTGVVAVIVNDQIPLGARTVTRLARRTAALLRRRGADVPGDLAPLRTETRWLGAGYGHHIPEADAAAALLREEGVALEPVYTGKAVAALLGLAAEGGLGEGPVLYWHTHHAAVREPASA